MKKKKNPETKQDITMKSVFAMCCKKKMCALHKENLSHPCKVTKLQRRVLKVPNWYSLEMHCSLSVIFLRYFWESLKALIYSNCIILAGFIRFLFDCIFSLQLKLALVFNLRIEKSVSHLASPKPLGDLDSRLSSSRSVLWYTQCDDIAHTQQTYYTG